MNSFAPAMIHSMSQGCSLAGTLPTDAEYAAEYLLPKTLYLSPDLGVFAHKNGEICPVNHPGRNVGGVEIIHRDPSSSDSSACASSTSRSKTSRRNRVQQTSDARQRNAAQLISNTCAMRGSSDPPPPITGEGCCVRKNQIEK